MAGSVRLLAGPGSRPCHNRRRRFSKLETNCFIAILYGLVVIFFGGPRTRSILKSGGVLRVPDRMASSKSRKPLFRTPSWHTRRRRGCSRYRHFLDPGESFPCNRSKMALSRLFSYPAGRQGSRHGEGPRESVGFKRIYSSKSFDGFVRVSPFLSQATPRI